MVHRSPRPGDHQGVPRAGGQVMAPTAATGAVRCTAVGAGGAKGLRDGLTGGRVLTLN